MNTRNLQDMILQLKKERGVCILAHAYQSQDILEVADYVGDSYGLSVEAAKANYDTIVMCGVRFMAETVKLLSPNKKVLLANPMTGCPMAQQLTRDSVLALKEAHPNHTICAYINTTTDVKCVADVIVTSSSAVKIIKRLQNNKILFLPDSNLGAWVAQQIPEKQFSFFQGGCPTHMRMRKSDVDSMKTLHPVALLLVHPECLAEVTKLADFVGSTTEIMKFAEESTAKEFLIGTENHIVQHLQFQCPDKKFYPLSVDCTCHDMCSTTLMDVYQSVLGNGGEEIILSPDTITEARKSIDRMVTLGA